MSGNYFKERDKKNMNIVTQLSTSLPPAVTEYINAVSLSRAPSTLANYSRQLNIFFTWIHDNDIVKKAVTDIDFNDLSNITTDDVVLFMHELKFAGDSDETLRAYLRAISAFYVHFIKIGKLKANPVDGVARPKHKKSPRIYLDKADTDKYMHSVNTADGLTDRESKYRDTIQTASRDILIVNLLYDTGVRVSELVGLDIKDIDLQRCRMTVQRKGGDINLVYFSDASKQYILDYLDVRKKIVADNEDALLLSFVGTNKGHRMSVRSVEILIKKYAAASAVTNAQKFTPHKMRHTCGMSLLKATHDISLVKKQFGHRNITSTTIYAETDDSDVAAVRNIRREEITESEE